MGALARAVVEEELAAGDVGAAIALERGGAAAMMLRAVGGDPALPNFTGILAFGSSTDNRKAARCCRCSSSVHDAE